MDDELNILPISSHIRSITPVPVEEVGVDSLHLRFILTKQFIFYLLRNINFIFCFVPVSFRCCFSVWCSYMLSFLLVISGL